MDNVSKISQAQSSLRTKYKTTFSCEVAHASMSRTLGVRSCIMPGLTRHLVQEYVGTVTFIRKLRASIICFAYLSTCYLWVFVQPCTGRRPVDWCRGLYVCTVDIRFYVQTSVNLSSFLVCKATILFRVSCYVLSFISPVIQL